VQDSLLGRQKYEKNNYKILRVLLVKFKKSACFIFAADYELKIIQIFLDNCGQAFSKN